MAADIDAVALMHEGARDAADVVGAFIDNGFDVRAP
jgi:hypothetical protein